MVSVNDYDGLNGFGTMKGQDLDQLSKALEAGYQIVNQTGGSALRVESLEASLKVVTFTNAHIKLWKKIPKSPAYSTVEEYNQLSGYGAAGSFAFTREGELPQASDSTYTRRTQLVKFVGTTREVTHPATLIHPAHGDVIALENQNGILYILERVEDSLFHGDSSLAFDGEAEQWDGLDALIDPTSFLDLEGQPIQEADIEEAANSIVEAFGYPSDLFLGTRVMSDLVKTFYPRERIMLPAPSGGQVGHAINTIATQAGVLQFNPDVFLRQLATPPAAATSANAPLAPGNLTSVVNAALVTADWEKLVGTPAANTLFSYCVTACNRFGESAPFFIAANQALTPAEVGLGNTIDLIITNQAVVGANPPEYFKLYRSLPLAAGTVAVSADVNDYSEILRIPAASQAGLGQTLPADGVRDLNFLIPFTQIAYMGEMTPQVLTFRQLAPLMKMDLAVLAPAYRWMVLLYGTPILFAPQKWLRMINIGQV
jgi:hypothetical protein